MIEWSVVQVKTSRRQASVLRPVILAGSMSERRPAARPSPRSEPAKRQFFQPTTTGLIVLGCGVVGDADGDVPGWLATSDRVMVAAPVGAAASEGKRAGRPTWRWAASAWWCLAVLAAGPAAPRVRSRGCRTGPRTPCAMNREARMRVIGLDRSGNDRQHGGKGRGGRRLLTGGPLPDAEKRLLPRQLEELDHQRVREALDDERARKRITVAGINPGVATAVLASIGDISRCQRPETPAGCIGLTLHAPVRRSRRLPWQDREAKERDRPTDADRGDLARDLCARSAQGLRPAH